MTTDPAKLAEFNATLTKWREAFLGKENRPHCPHKDDHEEWFDLVDMKYDGYTSFTYRVTACCPAFEILVLQAATEERMFNPPHFDTGIVKPKYETEKDHRGEERQPDRESDRKAAKEVHDHPGVHEHHGLAETTRSNVEQCFLELWSDHDAARIKNWVAADCRCHDADGGVEVGSGQVEMLFAKLHQEIPDIRVEVRYHVVEHDKAASLLRISGNPKSSKTPLNTTAMTFSRWHEGKIVEAWNLADLDGLLLKISANFWLG